jgi:hypothetical protein
MIELSYLIDQLERLPSRIARKGTETEEARALYDIVMAELDVLKGKRALEIKAKNPNLSATLLKYEVMQDIEIYKKQMDVIDKEVIYKKKEVERKELDDRLMSYKVIARIKMNEMKSINGGL